MPSQKFTFVLEITFYISFREISSAFTNNLVTISMVNLRGTQTANKKNKKLNKFLAEKDIM